MQDELNLEYDPFYSPDETLAEYSHPELTCVANLTTRDLQRAKGNLIADYAPAVLDMEPAANLPSEPNLPVDRPWLVNECDQMIAYTESTNQVPGELSRQIEKIQKAARIVEDDHVNPDFAPIPDAHILAPASAIDFPSALTVRLDDEAEIDASWGGLAGAAAYDHDYLPDIDVNQVPDVATACEFICGCAGSGKSFELRRRVEENPMYATLAASTGIAAVNLGATTINSLLGFFDTNSLRDAFFRGTAQKQLKRLVREGYQNVALDEISMVNHDSLDLIVKVFDDVNQNLRTGESPIGLILIGDFAQLPPITENKSKSKSTPWAFEAQAWERFEANTTRLTKVWRQADQRFLAALNYARSGHGDQAVGALASAGLDFKTSVDMEFDGTTIVATNTEVDRFNSVALDRVVGRRMILPARRWGQQKSEWKNIPDQCLLRDNAYVMLLSNKSTGIPGQFEYVNGDCGHVRGVEMPKVANVPPYLLVELVRNGQVVRVAPIVRAVEHKERPSGMTIEVSLGAADDQGRYLPKCHYRTRAERFVTGQVEYYPARLAYASTVHKVQGLSLDRVQIDCRSWNFSQPSMMYVALSRARNIEGLRLVGMKEKVAKNCKIDLKVARWL